MTLISAELQFRTEKQKMYLEQYNSIIIPIQISNRVFIFHQFWVAPWSICTHHYYTYVITNLNRILYSSAPKHVYLANMPIIELWRPPRTCQLRSYSFNQDFFVANVSYETCLRFLHSCLHKIIFNDWLSIKPRYFKVLTCFGFTAEIDEKINIFSSTHKVTVVCVASFRYTWQRWRELRWIFPRLPWLPWLQRTRTSWKICKLSKKSSPSSYPFSLGLWYWLAFSATIWSFWSSPLTSRWGTRPIYWSWTWRWRMCFLLFSASLLRPRATLHPITGHLEDPGKSNCLLYSI